MLRGSLIPALTLLLATGLGLPARAGEIRKVEVSELRPTQLDVGMLEVELRVQQLNTLRKDKKALRELRRAKMGRVVIGPGGRLYLIDGHHFARSLEESGLKKKMYVEVVDDFSGLSKKKFWARMEALHYVYLKDQTGRKRLPSELPRKIRDLGDDPFRSLAYLVRKAGGYRNGDTPFQEFSWADFFRQRMPAFSTSNRKELDAAYSKALKLASSAEAKDLPGFIKKPSIRACIASKLIQYIETRYEK